MRDNWDWMSETVAFLVILALAAYIGISLMRGLLI